MDICLDTVCKGWGPLSSGKTYWALDNVSLQVASGAVMGIIGKSGAGKSTLLRCINGLEQPTSGKVLLNSKALQFESEEALRALRKQVGMIFQHFNLLARKTVLENVALPLQFSGMDKRTALKKAAEWVHYVGLTPQSYQYPSKLSGGQKQRVGIARALVLGPKVLLCDEATSGLDPETTQSILALLSKLNKELGLTIILITHEIQVVRSICTQVAVLEKGRIVETGTTEAIFTSPQAPLTKRFIHSLVWQQLPDVIKANMHVAPLQPSTGSIVLRLLFRGDLADKPLIAQLTEQFQLHPNIKAGYIDQIGNTPFGNLIITLPYKEGSIEKALNFLKSKGVVVEQLGYINES